MLTKMVRMREAVLYLLCCYIVLEHALKGAPPTFTSDASLWHDVTQSGTSSSHSTALPAHHIACSRDPPLSCPSFSFSSSGAWKTQPCRKKLAYPWPLPHQMTKLMSQTPLRYCSGSVLLSVHCCTRQAI